MTTGPTTTMPWGPFSFTYASTKRKSDHFHELPESGMRGFCHSLSPEGTKEEAQNALALLSLTRRV
jgi:hypothetical protein